MTTLNFIPANGKIAVKAIKISDRSDSGLTLPNKEVERLKEEALGGPLEVLAVGDNINDTVDVQAIEIFPPEKSKVEESKTLSVGDFVLMQEGTLFAAVEIEGQSFYVLDYFNVLGKLDNPEKHFKYVLNKAQKDGKESTKNEGEGKSKIIAQA